METHHHQHQPGAETDEAALAELLDLDAEVLHSYLSDVTDWVRELAAGLPPAGSSTWAAEPVPAALALAPALRGGRGDRPGHVRATCWTASGTRPATRPGRPGPHRAGRPGRGLAGHRPVDLAWASSSLHHMADPGSRSHRGLRRAPPRRAPGGGRDGPVPALPARRPRPGPPRAGSALPCRPGRKTGRRVPHLGSDWGPRLSQGRLHHRGRADLRHRPDAPAARRPPAVTLRRPCDASGPASTAR